MDSTIRIPSLEDNPADPSKLSVGENGLIRGLMDHLPDYVFLKDARSRFLFSNLSHRRFLGVPLDAEITGKTDFDFFPPEFAARYQADEQKVIQTGQPIINKEEEVLDSIGRRHIVITTRVPLEDSGGHVVGTFSLSRDITEQKRIERTIQEVHGELERRVQDRTADLVRTNAELRKEIAHRQRVEETLRETVKRYRTLFEGSKDVVFISSPEGKFLDINPAGVDLYKYASKEELLKIDMAKDLYFNPDDRKEFQTELARQGFVKDYEMVLKRKDGQKVVVLETAIAVRDDMGNVISYMGFTRDITERKRAQEALARAHLELEQRVRERTADLEEANRALQLEIAERRRAEEALRDSEERYRKLFEESRDAIYITTQEGKILEMNQFALDLFGYSKGELVGCDVADLLINPNDRTKFQQRIDVKGYVRDYEVKMKKKDGATYDCLLTSTVRRSTDGKLVGYQGIIRDITERKRADQELRNSRQRLREFAARLQAVREEEKQRIAREIHDELGQVLTGLKIDLSWLARKVAVKPAPSIRDDRTGREEVDLHKKIKSMIALLDNTVQRVRRISRELRPSVLEHLGLLGTLEWQAHEFETRTGITCTVSSDIQEVTLRGQDQAIAVFRIFQEALTNVVRHAHASEVKVTLSKDNGTFNLVIGDNGKGIQDLEMAGHKSLGILGMRERALLLGGHLAIDSAPDRGTTVRLQIPIEPGTK